MTSTATSLALALLLARPAPVPRPAPTPVEVSVGGTVLTATVSGSAKHRYQMVVPGQGTVVITVDRIHGRTPRVMLRTPEGKGIRRADRRGKIWARRVPGEVTVLEIEPFDKQSDCTYQLTVAFDVDRPKAERQLRRPSRPREIVRVPARQVEQLVQAQVGGLLASHTVSGRDVLVTIPAFAQSGPILLHFESGPPTEHAVELIGLEPARPDTITDGCKGSDGATLPGCLSLAVSPSVGPQWLAAVARLVDADVTRHVVKDGAVELRLRRADTEAFALDVLKDTAGVISVERTR